MYGACSVSAFANIIWGMQLGMFRDYPWLCSQGSSLEGLKRPYGAQVIKLGQLHARQASYKLYYLSSPRKKFILIGVMAPSRHEFWALNYQAIAFCITSDTKTFCKSQYLII